MAEDDDELIRYVDSLLEKDGKIWAVVMVLVVIAMIAIWASHG